MSVKIEGENNYINVFFKDVFYLCKKYEYLENYKYT